MNGESAHVRRVQPDEWQLWRSLRLQALADSPEAFGSTLEHTRQRSNSYWQELIPTDGLSDRIFLVAQLGDRLAGMVRADVLSGITSLHGLASCPGASSCIAMMTDLEEGTRWGFQTSTSIC